MDAMAARPDDAHGLLPESPARHTVEFHTVPNEDGSPSEFVELISHGNRMRYPVMFLLRRVQGNPLDLRLVAKFRVDDNGAPLVLLELGERVTGLMRDGVEWKVGE